MIRVEKFPSVKLDIDDVKKLLLNNFENAHDMPFQIVIDGKSCTGHIVGVMMDYLRRQQRVFIWATVDEMPEPVDHGTVVAYGLGLEPTYTGLWKHSTYSLQQNGRSTGVPDLDHFSKVFTGSWR